MFLDVGLKMLGSRAAFHSQADWSRDFPPGSVRLRVDMSLLEVWGSFSVVEYLSQFGDGICESLVVASIDKNTPCAQRRNAFDTTSYSRISLRERFQLYS